MDEFHGLDEKEDRWTYAWWTQNERKFMDCGTMKLWCVHDNESRPIPRLNLSLIQNMNNYQTMMNLMVLIYNDFTLTPFKYMTPQMSQQ